MNSIRLVSIATLIACLSACTITQYANPVETLIVSGAEVCVLEKLDVREDFRSALLVSLRRRAFAPRILRQGSSLDQCPLALFYNAKYSWDFVMYMGWAELVAYESGVRAGDALYSDPTGG